jgi:hypothetical protein
MCVSEESVARESTALGAGCASGTAAARAAFATSKAAALGGGHSSVLGPPWNASVRGWNVRAISKGNICKNSPFLKTVVIVSHPDPEGEENH